LAKQFGSSTSTISRLLQDAIPDHQYRQLVGKKVGRGRKTKAPSVDPVVESPTEPVVEQLVFLPEIGETEPIVSPPEEAVGEAIAEIAAEFDGLPAAGEEFEPDDDEDDIAEDDEDLPEVAFSRDEPLASVLPFATATLPHLCYLVVDRNAELVTRPAKDFSELGAFAAEEQLRIMPIFYNHRMAKRFADQHATHRVIKCPSELLGVTCARLRQRGIGYLLCDRQLYSLS
jgi:hypothetical protein